MKIRDKHFWPKVRKTRGCWYWEAAKNSKGYGVFGWWDSVEKKRGYVYAHRAVLIFLGIEIGGKDVHHICGRRACVNPDHLEVLSPRAHSIKARSEYGTIRKNRHNTWRFTRSFDTKEEAERFLRFGAHFDEVEAPGQVIEVPYGEEIAG